MQLLALLLVVVMAAVAFWGSSRSGRWVPYVLAIAGGLSVLGGAFLSLAPRDYMVRYPWTASVLHPWMVALDTAIALLVFCGFAVGLLARFVYGGAQRQRKYR